jgi:fructoselysine-6-P-deglycase FrlB-like protein
VSNHVSAEIASQPSLWRRAASMAHAMPESLPASGERVAVVGCGTSWFMAMAYAALREAAGFGETDAFAASEMPAGRGYDRIVAITRSGTTTEVLQLLERESAPSVALTAVADAPVRDVATQLIVLDFADEQSVVQTRFATTALALLRASLGEDVETVAVDAEKALQLPVADYLDVVQVTFLGRGWTVGLAHEAALKAREAAQFWAEAYPGMDYRHGPIAIAEPGRLVWTFGEPIEGLEDEVSAAGASLVAGDLDPMAQLVTAQRFAVALAQRRGLDPDRPRHLTRSVVLPSV